MKVSKKMAFYRGRPNDGEECRKCSMYIDPGQCSKVEGRVVPHGWCRFWTKKGGK